MRRRYSRRCTAIGRTLASALAVFAWGVGSLPFEDSLFIHWTNDIKGGPRRRLGLYIHWTLEPWPPAGNPQRIRDQVEFFAKVEHTFFSDMKRYLKEELGVKQIITASNFGSADEVRLGDLQRWRWTAGDAIELNSFFGSKPFISQDGNVIRTTHGQLELNREIGLLRIDAPKAQGVVGFLGAAGGAFDLTDVTVHCSNDFASLLVVPLDQQTLAASRRLLVQVGTQSFPTGWQTKSADWDVKGRRVQGVEIVSTGELPWQITDINASLTLRNPHIEHAILLDENGCRASEIDLQRNNERITLFLPRNTLYLVLEGNDTHRACPD